MSSNALGLPQMAPELKPIAPFLQRADELQAKEPVMAYWCAYYAAQIGISLKARSPAARNLLFELLAVLERMKEEVGPSDAINVESVSSAYVENFALKIFGMADNEDRKGEATRSTAKKFLAAANFLEVLKIFPKTPISESSEEKITYAKWKAADIAKAFREGRRPNPGPAGSGIETETPLTVDTSSGSPPSVSPISPPSSNGPSSQSQVDASAQGRRSDPPPPTNGKTSPKRSSPPPSMSAADIARANMAPREFQLKTPPRPGAHAVDGESSPGSWSTIATPGTDDRTKGANGFSYGEQDAPIRKKESGRGNSRLRSGWVSGELEGASDGSDEGANEASQKRTVRFTPSVTGGLSPPATPRQGSQTQSFANVQPASQPSATSSSPPSSNSINTPFTTGHARSSSGSSLVNLAANRGRSMSLSSSPPTGGGIPSTPRASTIITPQPLASSPPSSYRFAANASGPSPDPPSPQDLTPQQIAKAQKHCRFAISALDYEDADQARKELRAALAVLGSQA